MVQPIFRLIGKIVSNYKLPVWESFLGKSFIII